MQQNYQKLLRLKNENLGKERSNYPIYKIKIGDKIGYLLGSEHSVSVSTLPEYILEIISKSTNLFLENSAPTDEEYRRYLNNNKGENYWHYCGQEFTEDEIKFLEQIIIDSFKMTASTDGITREILALRFDLQLYVISSYVKVIDENSALAESKSDEASFEDQLYDLFESDKIFSLEEYGAGVSVLNKTDFDSSISFLISFVKNTLLPFFKLHYKEKESAKLLSDSEQQQKAELMEDVNKLCRSFDDSEGYSIVEYLSNPAAGYHLDLEISQGKFDMVNRNKVMAKNIMKTLEEDKQNLYVVGAAHLLGTCGLFNILKEGGVEIYIIDGQDVCENPKTFLYQLSLYKRSFGYVKDEILGVAPKNRSTLLCYT